MAVGRVEFRQARETTLGDWLKVCVVNTEQWSKLIRQRPLHVQTENGCGMPESYAVGARPVNEGASATPSGAPSLRCLHVAV
jgi:hypothetical protein